ncbi:hypothetical protein PHYBLDRAFT_143251 [Phycomyces blakesleeanus NRRL 1555(-)]|uniref:Protein transport protein SFT2 n=1 Tax=Phycomyces blakesleeanus (strain ATCC 8743b / DSM 1359 / FGSC 10004 / NBRC 33097 / NRRL 1555) TaxID=763407 RepID=A0A167NMD2_PHYB8|nr:hypothetical protein PHYBLDRAFT_143251 [Phycomyces blakesleeanus NRRL 1555(-)]OAD76269.1 hypothetical protein PHYBLDRAFT_143251 [Phycomyces blakesleeanus NRRL 1555(-)]|eukprot:XP_018294309.1 hypothetical protein PHYBLDRAFT_143251 [Phycomyces blakesleeanus NRRL 1555(-)]
MSNTTENTFRNSLRNFNVARSSPISLPAANQANQAANESSPFASIRNKASNMFSNVTSTVQDYVPIGLNSEEEEEPWYQMSRVEASKASMGNKNCMLLFVLAIFPGKFAATFTLGSILILVSIAMLRGPWSHLCHMISVERLPFTCSYLGTMGLTLYFSIGARKTIPTIIFAVCQLIALVWYFGSYIPGGISTLRYGTSYIGRRATSLLPI